MNFKNKKQNLTSYDRTLERFPCVIFFYVIPVCQSLETTQVYIFWWATGFGIWDWELRNEENGIWTNALRGIFFSFCYIFIFIIFDMLLLQKFSSNSLKYIFPYGRLISPISPFPLRLFFLLQKSLPVGRSPYAWQHCPTPHLQLLYRFSNFGIGRD